MPARSPTWRLHCSQSASASYLADLRNNRPGRPSGSRPLPSRPQPSAQDQYGCDNSWYDSTGSAQCMDRNIPHHDVTQRKRFSVIQSTSTSSLGGQKGRALVQEPTSNPLPPDGETVSPIVSSEFTGSAVRNIEKEEAHSIRQALQKIDKRDEEARLHAAAKMEAADLVWKHMNPNLAETERTAAYRNPDLPKKKYVIMDNGSALDQSKEKRSSVATRRSMHADVPEVDPLRITKRGSVDVHQAEAGTDYMRSNRRKSSGSRNISNGSSKGVFRNPEDQIYEEPEESSTDTSHAAIQTLPLRTTTRNPVLRGSRPFPQKTSSTSSAKSLIDRFEIYKNPSMHSRDAERTATDEVIAPESLENPETPKGRTMEIRSEEIRAATSMKRKDRSPKLPTPTAVSDRPGRPIVSFDPSWRPENRSPRTSMNQERPEAHQRPALPMNSSSAPILPTINVSGETQELPTINISQDNNILPTQTLNEPNNIPAISISCEPTPIINITIEGSNIQTHGIPTINLPDEAHSESTSRTSDHDDASKPCRPLPTITNPDVKTSTRPLPPTHTHSAPPNFAAAQQSKPLSRLPWLSRSPASTPGVAASCSACQLPIAGRVVTATVSATSKQKARFHPECFTCFHCSTKLECVSFYPEPEKARQERLGIDSNEEDDEPLSQTLVDDLGDFRFYCHLDFHEQFSPRCHNCKTPIEGAVVLAAGKAWHEGHFFCAECGDPFSSSSPFVESQGYAYCVSCHTRRTSSRCRACKKQILDEVTVEALGGKWHEECFRCDECTGDFGDEGRFFVREIELELTEKEKRKGANYKKVEERAVCQDCEARRLKTVDNIHVFI